MQNYQSCYNFDQYQYESRETAIYPHLMINGENGVENLNYIYPIIGLSGEVGEISEKLKKCLRDKHGHVSKDTQEGIKKELGDVLWYIAQLATDLGLSLSEIAQDNIVKLQDRKRRDKISGSGDNR